MGLSLTPESCCSPKGSHCSLRGAWLPRRHGPLPLPAGRGAGGPEQEPRDGQVEVNVEQGDRRQRGNGARLVESQAGSRAPGRRGLMHPERGWERAPKHSWRKMEKDGAGIRHFHLYIGW